MSGLFGLQSGNLLTAVRGDQITYGSFNYQAADLGNPYLKLADGSVNCFDNKPKSTKDGQQAYYPNNYSSNGFQAIDWLF